MRAILSCYCGFCGMWIMPSLAGALTSGAGWRDWALVAWAVSGVCLSVAGLVRAGEGRQ